MEIEEAKFTYEIGVGDFESVFKRKPKDQDEFDNFAHYCKKGMDRQLDWTIICNCAKEAMRESSE